MTDEQKEIQAIAKVLYGHYCGKDECGKCKQPNCAEYRRAERIYEAGFRDTTQVRKETAKEIFEAVRPLLIMKNKKYGDDPMTVAANEWFNNKVQEIFEPYGVEVGK